MIHQYFSELCEKDGFEYSTNFDIPFIREMIGHKSWMNIIIYDNDYAQILIHEIVHFNSVGMYD